MSSFLERRLAQLLKEMSMPELLGARAEGLKEIARLLEEKPEDHFVSLIAASRTLDMVNMELVRRGIE